MAAGSRRYPGGGCRSGVELRAESADLSDCASVCRAGCLGCRDRAARADRSFDRPGSWLIGQAAVVSATVGLAIFGVESTSEGLALPELAEAASNVEPAQRVELVRAAHAVAAGTHGPSLVAMALIIGLPLLLLGIAMVLDRHPSWLGWTGLVIGGATMLAAVGLFLIPSLFPGFLLSGCWARSSRSYGWWRPGLGCC